MNKHIHATAYKVNFDWFFSGEYWYCNRRDRHGKKAFISGCGDTPDAAFLDFLDENNLTMDKGNLVPNGKDKND